MTLPALRVELGVADAIRRIGARARDFQHWGWLAVALATLAGVVAPVVGLLYFATRDSPDSLWPHLIVNVLPVAARSTVILLLGVGAIVTVIGVGTAWLVTMFSFPGRRILEWALLLPLAIPTYIIAYAYLDVMHPSGYVQAALRSAFGVANPRDLWFPDIRSMGGCIFVLGVVLYPYVYLPTRAVLSMESAAVLAAARSLGAGPTRLLLRVALPLSRPAIAVGLSLALLEALNDIGGTSFLGVNTLTVAIYTTWLTRSSIEGAAQIALALLAVTLGLILVERWARRRQHHSGNAQSPDRPVPRALGRWAGMAATLACVLPLCFGFVVPAGYLGVQAMRRVETVGVPGDLFHWLGNSVVLAVAATILTLGLGLVLAYTLRLVHGPVAAIIVRAASVGYAIPGTVLAVGLLVPLAAFDNFVDGWARDLFGVSTGLLITGSGAALVVAYAARFLAVSVGSIEAGFAKIDPAMDMSARSLGAGPSRAMMRIHIPLLRPALIAGALLVFVDCMKELPATLLLRPFDFETLATHIYAEAARGIYEDGALAALAIVVVSLVPVFILAWTSKSAELQF